MLFASLLRWYAEDPARWQLVLNVNQGKSPVSLRALDWLATNLSKCHTVTYYVGGKPFNLHASYKSSLNSYKKSQFDPFRRGPSFFFDGRRPRPDWSSKKSEALQPYRTTVGQLNFFRWCITNNVLLWAKKNIALILRDMNRPKGPRTPRRPLRSCDPIQCVRYNKPTVIHVATAEAPNPFSLC